MFNLLVDVTPKHGTTIFVLKATNEVVFIISNDIYGGTEFFYAEKAKKEFELYGEVDLQDLDLLDWDDEIACYFMGD